MRCSGRLGVADADAPSGDDNEPLDTPVDEEFRVGARWAWPGTATRSSSWSRRRPWGEEPGDESTILEDVEEGPDVLRVRISAAEARAFVERAPPGGLRRPAAVPAVRAAARRRRAHLPAAERIPPRHGRVTRDPVRRGTLGPVSEPQHEQVGAGRRGGAGPAVHRLPVRRGQAGRREQHHALLLADPRRADDGVRLQARARGAAALGLPGRDAGRAGGRGVRGVGRPRVERGAADRAARRPVRRRHGPAVDRRRRDRRPDRAGPHRHRPAAADGPCSTR